MNYDYLIVGSGLSGASIARLLTDQGKKVLVLEARDHVGGNIATHVEDDIVLHEISLVYTERRAMLVAKSFSNFC